MTHARQLSDEELVENAANLDDEEHANFFPDSEAYYKLFNSTQGACFFFENNEDDRTLTARFDLQIENLYIEEDPQSSVFFVNVPPGESCYKILRLTQVGENTSIGMTYTFEFQS